MSRHGVCMLRVIYGTPESVGNPPRTYLSEHLLIPWENISRSVGCAPSWIRGVFFVGFWF